MTDFLFWFNIGLAALYLINLVINCVLRNWSAVCGWSCALILILGIIGKSL